MLKWLRKYNTWILVVGGVLLMVAFLLPQTIQELGRRKLSGPVFKYSGGSITGEEYGQASREFSVVAPLLRSSSPMQVRLAAENTDHWIMLTREAEDAGLVGGPRDGQDLYNQLIDSVADFGVRFMRLEPEKAKEQARLRYDEMVRQLSADAKLTQDQVFQGLAKLKGTFRLQALHDRTPRYSDRRLILGAKELAGSASVEYFLIPAEREMGSVPAPTDAEIQAHFDKYKNAEPGSGEFGIGYQLPDRVKLQWMTVNRELIKKAILPDAVEIEKRFLKLYPSGKPPAGIDEAAERTKIQTAVVNEQADRVMKTIDQTVRAEFDKAKRKLEPDGDYLRLPTDWAAQRPSFEKLADLIVTRVQEQHSIKIARPTLNNADDRWLNSKDFAGLPGIGSASLQVGNRSEPFTRLPMLVKELDGSKSLFLQAGVPSSDAVQDTAGSRYYFMISEARKRSGPDTLAEVHDQVVRDIRRLGGYQRLLTKLEAMRDKASTSGGLEALAQPEPNAEGDAARTLTISKATVESSRFSPPDQNVDSDALRKDILQVASALDPTVDIKTIPESQRVLLRPVPKSLGVFAGRISGISPVTVERLRGMSSNISFQLQRQELPRDPETNPFTLAAMEKRLNVEYLDGRKSKTETSNKDKPVAAKAAQ